MADKDPPGKISRLYGWGRGLMTRWPLARNGPAAPEAKKAFYARLGLLLGLSLLLSLLLTPKASVTSRTYLEKDIARVNVKATESFLVEDAGTTAKRREELLAQTPMVFDLQEELGEQAHQRLHRAMEYMRRVALEAQAAEAEAGGPGSRSPKGKTAASLKVFTEHKSEFDRLLGINLPQTTFLMLVKAEFSPYLEALTGQVLGQFYRQGIISQRFMPTPETREIVLRRLPSRGESLDRAPFPFVQVEEGRKSAASYCREMVMDASAADRWLVCDLTQHLLTPNVTPNWAETEERRQASLKKLQPVYFKVHRGELLVREGEVISPLHLAKLEAQSRIYPKGRGALVFLGYFISLTLLLLVCYRLACLAWRRFARSVHDLAFMAALLLAGALVNKGLLIMGEHLARNLPSIGHSLVYALPLGLPSIFAAMFQIGRAHV